MSKSKSKSKQQVRQSNKVGNDYIDGDDNCDDTDDDTKYLTFSQGQSNIQIQNTYEFSQQLSSFKKIQRSGNLKENIDKNEDDQKQSQPQPQPQTQQHLINQKVKIISKNHSPQQNHIFNMMMNCSNDSIDDTQQREQLKLDKEILKMIKSTDVEQLYQFSQEFFKNQHNGTCDSLKQMVNKEIAKRMSQEELKVDSGDNVGEDIQRNNQRKKGKEKEKQTNPTKGGSNQHHYNDKKSIQNNQNICNVIQKNKDDEEFKQLERKMMQFIQSGAMCEMMNGIEGDQEATDCSGINVACGGQARSVKKGDVEYKIGAKQLEQLPEEEANISSSSEGQQDGGNSKGQTNSQMINVAANLVENEAQLESDPNQNTNTNDLSQQQNQFEQFSKQQLPDGRFLITYNNGDIYKGQFQPQLQMKSGWGEYHYSSGQKYIGLFQQDEIQGYGRYYFLGGAEYEGDWSSGAKHGMGILKFAGGDVYEGGFVDDLYHGKGVYKYKNGDVFEGMWRHGKKHGKGRLDEMASGGLKIGFWVNDVFQV